MLDIMLFAHILKPVGTLSARCYDYIVGGNGKFFALRLTARKEYRAFCSAVLDNQIHAFRFKDNLNAVVGKMLFDFPVKLLCHFCAEMTYGTIHKLQSCLYRTQSYRLDFFVVTYALDLFIGTERKIYSVRILYHLLSELMPDKVRQISADFAAERKLAV